MNGFLIVDKPKGMSSFDVLRRLKRILGNKKMGHTGTLDPMATGVMVVAIGQGTKLIRYLNGDRKRYRGMVELGIQTDTDDAEGEVVERRPFLKDRESVEEAIELFRGEFLQVPPAYSARHVDGVRAYKLARRGERPELKASLVKVSELVVRSFEFIEEGSPRARVEVELEVSSGTYIRSIARDLGEELACGGHLSALRRLRVGRFSLRDALTLEEIAAQQQEGSVRLISMAAALDKAILLEISEEEARGLVFGRYPKRDYQPGLYKLCRVRGEELLALIRVAENGESKLRVFM